MSFSFGNNKGPPHEVHPTDNIVGKPIEICFTDDQEGGSDSQIKINGTAIVLAHTVDLATTIVPKCFPVTVIPQP